MKRSRASLAVAGMLSMPLFFTALMAMSLAVEKPQVSHVLKGGKSVLHYADPSGSNEAKIWLLAVLPPLLLLLVGMLGVRFGRLGVVGTSVAAIAITVVLLIPLGTWARDHGNRFPVGVDLIPPSAGSEDVYLKGEWERNAKTSAEQIGGAAIGIAVAAILVVGLLEVRRRRGALVPVPPPPASAMGGVPPTGL